MRIRSNPVSAQALARARPRVNHVSTIRDNQDNRDNRTRADPIDARAAPTHPLAALSPSLRVDARPAQERRQPFGASAFLTQQMFRVLGTLAFLIRALAFLVRALAFLVRAVAFLASARWPSWSARWPSWSARWPS